VQKNKDNEPKLRLLLRAKHLSKSAKRPSWRWFGKPVVEQACCEEVAPAASVENIPETGLRTSANGLALLKHSALGQIVKFPSGGGNCR
jgi:hypothetical protein